jgi:hypothetical protein
VSVHSCCALDPHEHHTFPPSPLTPHLPPPLYSLRSWKRRYFVLDGFDLNYYRSDSESDLSSSPRGSIDLRGAELFQAVHERFGPRYMEVHRTAQGAKYPLAAADPEEYDQWLRTLIYVINLSIEEEEEVEAAQAAAAAAAAESAAEEPAAPAPASPLERAARNLETLKKDVRALREGRSPASGPSGVSASSSAPSPPKAAANAPAAASPGAVSAEQRAVLAMMEATAAAAREGERTRMQVEDLLSAWTIASNAAFLRSSPAMKAVVGLTAPAAAGEGDRTEAHVAAGLAALLALSPAAAATIAGGHAAASSAPAPASPSSPFPAATSARTTTPSTSPRPTLSASLYSPESPAAAATSGSSAGSPALLGRLAAAAAAATASPPVLAATPPTPAAAATAWPRASPSSSSSSPPSSPVSVYAGDVESARRALAEANHATAAAAREAARTRMTVATSSAAAAARRVTLQEAAEAEAAANASLLARHNQREERERPWRSVHRGAGTPDRAVAGTVRSRSRGASQSPPPPLLGPFGPGGPAFPASINTQAALAEAEDRVREFRRALQDGSRGAGAGAGGGGGARALSPPGRRASAGPAASLPRVALLAAKSPARATAATPTPHKRRSSVGAADPVANAFAPADVNTHPAPHAAHPHDPAPRQTKKSEALQALSAVRRTREAAEEAALFERERQHHPHHHHHHSHQPSGPGESVAAAAHHVAVTGAMRLAQAEHFHPDFAAAVAEASPTLEALFSRFAVADVAAAEAAGAPALRLPLLRLQELVAAAALLDDTAATSPSGPGASSPNPFDVTPDHVAEIAARVVEASGGNAGEGEGGDAAPVRLSYPQFISALVILSVLSQGPSVADRPCQLRSLVEGKLAPLLQPLLRRRGEGTAATIPSQAPPAMTGAPASRPASATSGLDGEGTMRISPAPDAPSTGPSTASSLLPLFSKAAAGASPSGAGAGGRASPRQLTVDLDDLSRRIRALELKTSPRGVNAAGPSAAAAAAAAAAAGGSPLHLKDLTAGVGSAVRRPAAGPAERRSASATAADRWPHAPVLLGSPSSAFASGGGASPSSGDASGHRGARASTPRSKTPSARSGDASAGASAAAAQATAAARSPLARSPPAASAPAAAASEEGEEAGHDGEPEFDAELDAVFDSPPPPQSAAALPPRTAALSSSIPTLIPPRILASISPNGTVMGNAEMRAVFRKDRRALETIFRHYADLRVSTAPASVGHGAHTRLRPHGGTAGGIAALPHGADPAASAFAAVPHSLLLDRSLLFFGDLSRFSHEFSIVPALMSHAGVFALFVTVAEPMSSSADAGPHGAGEEGDGGGGGPVLAVRMGGFLELLGRICVAAYHVGGPLLPLAASALMLLRRMDAGDGRKAMARESRGAAVLRFSARSGFM